MEGRKCDERVEKRLKAGSVHFVIEDISKGPHRHFKRIAQSNNVIYLTTRSLNKYHLIVLLNKYFKNENTQ